MKPERLFTLITGITLVAVGAISLLGNIFFSTQSWRLWPIIVVLAGLGLTAPGFFGLSRRGLGAFFIPGLPVLTTGSILLYASLTRHWDVWAVAWPLEILAVAFGFLLSAIFMRAAGLAIPAFIIGLNGLLLGFCAVTGLWQAWAILWPIEPLSVGLGLGVLGIVNKSAGVKLAATILFSIAGLGFFITAFISMFNHTILRFAVPFMLLVTGLLLVGSFFLNQKAVPMEQPATE
ncbi:MAG: hypothetical protein MUO77_05540 [Anaerolineales bacterium]|nr:hypothetical protein [Anaerolineales bacterium]